MFLYYIRIPEAPGKNMKLNKYLMRGLQSGPSDILSADIHCPIEHALFFNKRYMFTVIIQKLTSIIVKNKIFQL